MSKGTWWSYDFSWCRHSKFLAILQLNILYVVYKNIYPAFGRRYKVDCRPQMQQKLIFLEKCLGHTYMKYILEFEYYYHPLKIFYQSNKNPV